MDTCQHHGVGWCWFMSKTEKLSTKLSGSKIFRLLHWMMKTKEAFVASQVIMKVRYNTKI